MSPWLLLAIPALILLAKNRKGKGNVVAMDKTEFWAKFLSWLRSMEGSLTTSSVESANPIPGTITYNGKEYTNPTGSGGITADTFRSYANRFGYTPDIQTFAKLSDGPANPIWVKIVTEIFNQGKKFTSHPVLSTYIGSWYWGSGSISQTSQQKIKDILAKNISDRQKLKQLVDLRKEFFRWLVVQKPEREKFLDGWLKRADDFYANFSKYA